MEWVSSTLHTTSEHGVSSITTADAHTPRLPVVDRNDAPPTDADLNGTVLFAERGKSGFCACAIIFQKQYTNTLQMRKTSAPRCPRRGSGRHSPALSPQKPDFSLGAGYVGFVVNKALIGKISLR